MIKALRLFPENTSFDFVGWRWPAFVVSGLLIAVSIFLTAFQGLNFGIDFRGGILIEVQTPGPADIAEMRRDLSGLGLGEVSLQEFGAPDEVLIRIQRQEGGETAQAAAIDTVQAQLGEGVEYRRIEFVGPQVGEELRRAGTIAVLLAMGAIMVYIWFRFEWQYGVAALVALAHDVITTVGLFALLQLDFNLATVAAVLTIAGYSINDTVVIFDRVRENLRRFKTAPLPEVLNRSVNETLSRTFMTSGTTLLAVLALYVFGGAVIRDFTLALIWGIVIGTYSTMYVAVPLLLYLGLRRTPATASEEEQDLPAGAVR